MPSMQQDKQVIDSLFQNLAWETDPNWIAKLQDIKDKIESYWDTHLDGRHHQIA